MDLAEIVETCAVSGRFLEVGLDGQDGGAALDTAQVAGFRCLLEATWGEASDRAVALRVPEPSHRLFVKPVALELNQAGELVNPDFPDGGLSIVATNQVFDDPFLWRVTITAPGWPVLQGYTEAPAGESIDLAEIVQYMRIAPSEKPEFVALVDQVLAARAAVIAARAETVTARDEAVQARDDAVAIAAGDVIRDTITSTAFTWSSSRMDEQFAAKAHTHDTADIVGVLGASQLPAAAVGSRGAIEVASTADTLAGEAPASAVSPAGLRATLEDALPVDVRFFGAVGDGVTDDTAAIQAAITAAGGGRVVFPAGTYKVSASLDGYWGVHREGDGVLTDGDSLHHIRPGHGVVNMLQVHGTLGNDTNDGLFPHSRKRTLVGAREILRGLSADEAAAGQWGINVAGVIAGGCTFREIPQFKQPLIIQGEPLNSSGKPVTRIEHVPGSSEVWGVRFDPAVGARVEINNIEFRGFNTTYGYGVLMKSLGNIEVTDCVARDCTQGFAAINSVVGVFDRCEAIGGSSAFFAQYSSTVTWRNCLARDALRGFYATRNSVAHLDYCEARNNSGQGLWVDMAARVAVLDSHFKRNAIGILATGAGEWSDQGASFYYGTSDANTVATRFRGVGRITQVHSDRGRAEWLYDFRRSPVSASGGTVEFYNPASDYLLPRQYFDDQRQLRLRLSGGVSGTSGDKTLTVRLGDAAWTGSTVVATVTLPAAYTGQWAAEIELVLVGGTLYASGEWRANGHLPVVFAQSTAFTQPATDIRYKVFGATGGASTLQLLKFESFIRG